MSGAKSINKRNVSYSKQIPRTGPLTLVNRANFLPLTETNPTDDWDR